MLFPYQSIINFSLFDYESDHGFHLTFGVTMYISSVTSIIEIDAFDVDKYENIPCRKNRIKISNLGKYML